MKTIYAFKAQGFDETKPIQSVSLILDNEFPLGIRHPLSEHAQQHDLNAEIIFQVLITALPGGTIDQLTTKLLNHKACLLSIPYERS